MQIPTKEIRDGGHIGETVWICHYHRPDLDKKPLRNVPPTKVKIADNDELPYNKRVYYSLAHFRPFNKSGKLSTRIISPVDNTGFRSRCGNELFVFTTEEECLEEWKRQVLAVCDRLDGAITTAGEYWKREKSRVISLTKEVN